MMRKNHEASSWSSRSAPSTTVLDKTLAKSSAGWARFSVASFATYSDSDRRALNIVSHYPRLAYATVRSLFQPHGDFHSWAPNTTGCFAV
jgi:hypothetical protein